jgi:hypothetical protein
VLAADFAFAYALSLVVKMAVIYFAGLLCVKALRLLDGDQKSKGKWSPWQNYIC